MNFYFGFLLGFGWALLAVGVFQPLLWWLYYVHEHKDKSAKEVVYIKCDANRKR